MFTDVPAQSRLPMTTPGPSSTPRAISQSALPLTILLLQLTTPCPSASVLPPSDAPLRLDHALGAPRFSPAMCSSSRRLFKFASDVAPLLASNVLDTQLDDLYRTVFTDQIMYGSRSRFNQVSHPIFASTRTFWGIVTI
ncbi:hypothetical protein C8R46DRAFT_1224179 [Mycena filopes]|nr:hypothetical protein C8R46DRAFT_1224179 [Mycena filopes]